MRLPGLALLSCTFALAIGCGRDPVGPTPRFAAWTDDGIFRYCRMLPSGNGHATMWTTNWLGEPCPVQPHPTPQGAFFGSANPDSIVFNFDGTALDIRGQLFCSGCPTTMRYTLYDTNGVVFEDQPVPVGADGFDLTFQRDVRRPCKKLVITANGPIPPDTYPGGVWGFWYLYYNPGCPQTNDTLFNNNPSVQRDLNLEWSRSKGEDLERGGWIYQDNSTGEYVVWTDPIASRDRCSVDLPKTPPPMAGHTPVRGWHTHIVPPGTSVGTNCIGLPPETRAHNGPSPDYDVPFVQDSDYPHIVIDEDQIHAMNSDGSYLSHKWINNCRAWS